MKTKELISKLEEMGFEVSEQNGEMVKVERQNADGSSTKINVGFDFEKDNLQNGLTVAEWEHFYDLLLDYVNTPVAEREDEPQYRVRLRGFSSDNGKQYLTCEHGVTGRIFACAQNPRLKQTFTMSELHTISTTARNNSLAWLTTLVHDPENLEKAKD